jgi:hypothetical protein
VVLTLSACNEIFALRHVRSSCGGCVKSFTFKTSTSAEFHIVQNTYPYTRDCLAATARLSEIIILARPTYEISEDKNLIQAMLFTSGRPIIVIPPEWGQDARFHNVLVAWDGGARAARAIGDAMLFLTRARSSSKSCVSPQMPQRASLVRTWRLALCASKRVTVMNLRKEHGDVAKTLHTHAAMVKADLLVMGAYTHSKLLQIVLGGVTSHMLAEAELPRIMYDWRFLIFNCRVDRAPKWGHGGQHSAARRQGCQGLST